MAAPLFNFEDFLSYNFRRFDFLRIGALCNGERSFNFLDAFCDLEVIYKVPSSMHPTNLCIMMKVLFKRGFDILAAQKSEKSIEMSDKEKKALEDIKNFLSNIETHERNILNALANMKTGPTKENDLSITIGQHLLSQLATQYSYSIDAQVQEITQNRTCKCGCKEPVHFEPTGIGHHKIWHGHVDILIKEKKNPVGIAKVVPVPTLLDDDDDEDDDDDDDDDDDECGPTSTKRLKTEEDEEPDVWSLNGDSISEVKQRHFDQTVAQAIVFACAQKSKTRSFIPNILMYQNKFYIVMYDPNKDILIWSGEFPLWSKNSPSSLNRNSVISLWMVLHFNLFCYGGNIIKNVDEVKAGFFNRIGKEKRKFYEEIDVGIANFETEELAIGPSQCLSDIIHPVEVTIEDIT